MGLWNFVKSAGKSIGIGRAEAAEMPPEPQALKNELKELGLPSDVDIAVEGETVTVKAENITQEEKEKVILAVGNVEGVAQVSDEIATSDTAKDPVFHTVEKGDSLWKIAEKTLGNGARYTEIFEANKPMLTDPDKIYPGQTLRIPQ